MAVSVSVCCARLRNFIPNFGHSSRAGGAGKVWDGERDHIRLNKLSKPKFNQNSIELNLRLDYILTASSTTPPPHHKLSVVVVLPGARLTSA